MAIRVSELADVRGGHLIFDFPQTVKQAQLYSFLF